MTIEQLKRAVEKRPFAPFKVFLAGGRSVPVAHPEVIWMPPGSSRTFVVFHQGAFDIIDLLLVESLQFSTGRPRRRRSA